MTQTLLILLTTLFSPSHNLSATFQGTSYTLSKGDTVVIAPSSLGLNMDNWSWEMALGFRDLQQYDNWMTPMVLDSAVQGELQDTLWTPFYGERSLIHERYSTLRLYYSRHDKSNYRIEVEVQLYDYGMAFRYFLPEHPQAIFHRVVEDLTTYSLPANTTLYAQYWAQDHIHPINLQSSISNQQSMEMPLTFTLPNGLWGSIMTADVDHWCHTKLQLNTNQLTSHLLSPIDLVTYAYSPWKLIVVGSSAADLVHHGSDFVAMHAEKQANQDFSWVKPGKIMRCTQLTMEAARRTIDFCAEHNIDYMLFDWKWYMPCTSHDGDATQPIPELDIPALCTYAKTQGVGIWLYVNQHALMKQADVLFPLLKQWGVVGVKSGFVEYTTHYWSEWLHKLVRLAADNHLMMNIHDEYRPSGFSRTYPNLLTQEGICGNEEFPNGDHDVRLAFTRMLCGAADYTICYYDKRLHNTHGHQLAAALTYYSPLVTLFWYDTPDRYKGEPEMSFFEQMPTIWDETRILAGDPETYIVTARRSGKNWFIAVLNNSTERDITLSLTDLYPVGSTVSYVLYEDNDAVETATHIGITERTARLTKKTSTLRLHLKANGGATMIIKPDSRVSVADAKIHQTMEQMASVTDSMPRNVYPDETRWNLRANVPSEWCGGFWDGCLWYDYALTGKEDVLSAATKTARQMEYLATTPLFDHDLGFLTITSLLNGYRFSPSAEDREEFRTALLQCADSLALLYNPAVGTLLSWPRNVDMFGGHNTIMDNMMNLELLFWAAEQSAIINHQSSIINQQYFAIAKSHADTTMAYQFREDGSSHHVAVYNPESGRHIYNCTHQGLNDSSTWARGQAWAIYGYTMVYRYTRDEKYLNFAEKVTDWYLNHLPTDHIPYWDFAISNKQSAISNHQSPITNQKDASAAAIVASALYELSGYVSEDKAAYYRAEADSMLVSLATAYLAPESSPAILVHSTGHHPAGSEIDASIIYADYYYLEALYRMKTHKLFP